MAFKVLTNISAIHKSFYAANNTIINEGPGHQFLRFLEFRKNVFFSLETEILQPNTY